MPLDHIALFVPSPSYASIETFYTALLAPLNYVSKTFIPGTLLGMSADGGATFDFWIHAKEGGPRSAVHFAFKAPDREAVGRVYEEGVKAGGKGNGEPGIRELYGEGYFAAYVLDPCG